MKVIETGWISFHGSGIQLPAIPIEKDDLKWWLGYLSEHFPQWTYVTEELCEQGTTHVFRETWIRLRPKEDPQ